MGTAVHIILIWLAAWALLLVARNFLRLFKSQIIARISRSSDFGRIETLIGVGRHAAMFVIYGIAVMLTMGELGISITPVLATAGVAGIAIGFGAQSLVRDFFSGLFMLIENQVSEGDMIEAAGKSGYVEEVTLRHIRIRDEDGSVHFIPNGVITTVTNRSRDFAYAVIDVKVARKSDPEQIFGIVRRIASDMRDDQVFGTDMLADIEISGIDNMDDASLTVRSRIKVKPLKTATIRREFLRRIKLALDSPPGDTSSLETTSLL